MNRSFSKIRHIQETNANLEKRILNEKGWFSRKKKDDPMDLGGDKYNEMIRRMHDYDKNPTHTDLYSKFPHKNLPLKYSIMKVDDCESNGFFMTPTLDMVMIDYCNYDGEKFIEELDETGDEMWMNLKNEIEQEYNNRLEQKNLPRY